MLRNRAYMNDHFGLLTARIPMQNKPQSKIILLPTG